MRYQWFFVCSLWAGLVATRGAAQDFGGTLLVANRVGGSVSLFDVGTGIEMARLPIGPRFPHEVAVSGDGLRALTGEYGPDSDRGRHLVAIDVPAGRITGRIDLGPGSRPHSVVFLPDGRRAVATMEDADRIALVDTVSLEIVQIFPTGGREGHMVRLSPDGQRAYVTSRGAEGTLSVIDLVDGAPPVVIPTGLGAEGLAVTPDGAYVWVVNRAAESISIVDTAALAVVATLDAPLGAGRAEISAAGRVLVPNGMGARALPKFLTVYDAGTRETIQQVAMNGGEPAPGAYTIHIVDERAFVADRAEDSIALFDLTNFAFTPLVPRGHDGPDGMAYSPRRLDVFDRQPGRIGH